MPQNVKAIIMAIFLVVIFTDTSYATQDSWDDSVDDSVWGPASSDEERNTSLICQNRTEILDWLSPEQERVCLVFCWRWTCISLGTISLYVVCVCMCRGILWWLSARQSEVNSLHEPDYPRFRRNGYGQQIPVEAHIIAEYDHPLKEARFVDAEEWVHHSDYTGWKVKWSRTNWFGNSD